MALTDRQLRDLAEAISYAKYGMWKMGAEKKQRIQLDRLNGFSPKQLRDLLREIQDTKSEVEVFTKANEAIFKRQKELKDIAETNYKKLEDSIKSMGLNGQYCAEAEDALINWTSSIEGKPPGIEQMLATADETKEGKKAGELIQKIAAEFGSEVADKVHVIIKACKDDLTHMAPVVRYFKILEKTSSLDSSIIKTAGLLDLITEAKSWLSGKVTSVLGDIKEWAQGFAERLGLVKEASSSITSFVDKYTKELDKIA